MFFFYACIIPGILPSVCDFITFEKIAGPAAGSFRRAMIKRIRLLPEWNAFQPGVVVTGLGLAVLLAIGLPHEIAHGSLRLTLGTDTTKEQIDFVIEKLKEIVEKLRSMSPLYEDFISRGKEVADAK